MAKAQDHESDIRLKNERTWFGLLAKIIFIFSAIIILILTVFANMGGNSEALRSGVAEFTSRLFENRPATVDRLVNMRFFPTIGVDAEGINVQPFNGSSENIVSLKKVKFFMSFWDVFMGNQIYKVLYLSDFVIKENVWGDRVLKIDALSIQHDKEAKEAELVAKGKIGVYDWSIQVGMEVFGVGGDYRYSFSKDIPVNFEIADVHMTGRIMRSEDNFITINDFKLRRKDKEISGEISVFLAGDDGLQVKGQLSVNKADGILTFNTKIKKDENQKREISGDIKAVSLTEADISGADSLLVLGERLTEILSFSDIKTPVKTFYDFPKIYNLDLNLALEAFEYGDKKDNQVKFSIFKTDDYVKISKISGNMEDSALNSPDIFLVSLDNGYGFIAAAGSVNFSYYKYLGLKATSFAPFMSKESTDIMCMVGLYNHEAEGISGMVLHQQNDKKKFGKDISVLNLKPEVYSFISDALKSVDQNSLCLPYIATMKSQVVKGEAAGEAKN